MNENEYDILMIHGFLTEIVGSKWKEKKTSNRFGGLFAPIRKPGDAIGQRRFP